MNHGEADQGAATGDAASGDGQGPLGSLATGRARRLWCLAIVQALVIVAAAALLFLPALGATGFSMSEGHRVVPGWEMIESGNWSVPHMFGRVYLRKPPGMAWAIGASSWILGQTEFAARLVSALATTLMALAACWFARRWYGARWGLCAGLSLLLMPVFWSPARSAEIEALHNVMVLVAALAILDLGLARDARRGWMLVLLGGVAMGGALLAKGPAGVPVLAAAALATIVTPGASWRRVAGSVLVMGLIAGAMFAPVLLAMKQAAGIPDAVTQGVDEFLWSRQKLLEIATLPLMGLLAAFPSSLAMLFPWGRDARGEVAGADEAHARALRTARVCSIALLASLGMYTAIGVSNPRYVMPALGLAAMVTPYVLLGAREFFTPVRARILRRFIVSRPGLLAALMLIVGLCAVGYGDAVRTAGSGRGVGMGVARQILARTDRAVIVADHAIEARPEVLLEARRVMRRHGGELEVRWTQVTLENLPPVGGYLLVREDPGSGEAAALAAAGMLDGFQHVASGEVSKFKMGLYLRTR